MRGMGPASKPAMVGPNEVRSAPRGAIAAGLAVGVLLGAVVLTLAGRALDAQAASQDVQAAAGDTASIDGRVFRIAAEAPDSTTVWRDYMVSPNGSALLGVLRITTDDGGAFPDSVVPDRVWLYGPTVWETAPAEVRMPYGSDTGDSQIEVVVRNGPTWEPGTDIAVVVRLTSGGSSYYVRATVGVRRTI